MVFCNIIGHAQQNINQICIKKECLQNSACCKQCLQELHSDHQIKDFQNLEQFLENNWFSPKINHLLQTLEQIQELTVSYYGIIKELLTKSNSYKMIQQQPDDINNLNRFGLINKYRPLVEQNITKLENQFQSFKFQIESSYYKVLKSLIIHIPTSTIKLDDLKLENQQIFQGHSLFIKGEYRKALEQYAKCKTIDSIRLQINKAWCLHKIGNKQKSIELINELHLQYPQVIKIYLKRCIIGITSNQRQVPLELIRKKLIEKKQMQDQASSFKIKIESTVGQIMEEMKRYDEAILCYNKVIKINHESQKSYKKLANILDMIGRKHEAVHYCDFGILIDSQSGAFYQTKAHILDTIGKKQEAINCCDIGISINPWNSAFYQMKADILDSIYKKDEAIKCCDEAITRNAYDSKLLHYKARILYSMGKQNEAIECYNYGICKIAWDSELYADKAAILQYMGKRDEVVECCDQGISINEWDSMLYARKGEVLYLKQKLDDSIKCYDLGISKADWDSTLHSKKAEILDLMGKKTQAIECCNQGISNNAWSQILYKTKSSILDKMGSRDEAIKCYDLGISNTVWDSILYAKKAWALYMMNKEVEAIKCCNQAISINPWDTTLYWSKAYILQLIELMCLQNLWIKRMRLQNVVIKLLTQASGTNSCTNQKLKYQNRWANRMPFKSWKITIN